MVQLVYSSCLLFKLLNKCDIIFHLQDFSGNPNRTYPTSCCTSDITDQISISRRPLASAVIDRSDEHQKNFSDIADYIHGQTWSHVIPKDGISSSSGMGGTILNSESKIIATCRAVYPQVSKIITFGLDNKQKLNRVLIITQKLQIQTKFIAS